jgi:hypothetical protein
LADDITTISFNANKEAIIHPGIPQLKLWKDVLESLNIKEKTYRIRSDIEKYRLSVIDNFTSMPIGVSLIIVLGTKNSDGYQYKEIKGGEKVSTLAKNAYRRYYIEGLGKTKSFFENITGLAKNTTVFKVERPISPLNIIDFAKFIEEGIIKKMYQ